jgi:hypothetical protein
MANYIIQIKLQNGKVAQYIGLNDKTVRALKNAQIFDKDNAENCKRRLFANGYQGDIFILDKAEVSKKKENLFGAVPIYWDESRQILVKEKPQSLDCKWFGSTIEGQVYQILRNQYPKNSVICQYPLQIKPPTKAYKGIDWRCDFRLSARDFQGKLFLRNVEVKGLALPEFRRNIQYLQFFNPDEFSRLIIVGSETKKIDDNICQFSLAHFQHLITTGKL